MRTKTTLLTAALLAVGAISATAQSNVYSLNVVGYINIPIGQGYTLIANQLNTSNSNNIANVFGTNLPDGIQVIKWNAGAGSFTQPDTIIGGVWYDNNFENSTTKISPGEGVFVLNSTGVNTNVTFTGEVAQGTNSIAITPGYGFYSSIPPVVQDLTTNGLPKVNGLQYMTFANGSYSQPITYIDGFGWSDSEFNLVSVTPAVGQGFVLLNPGSTTNWTRGFTVQ